MLMGKAVVCACGEMGLVADGWCDPGGPAVVRHANGRSHRVYDFFEPTCRLEINADGYFEGGR